MPSIIQTAFALETLINIPGFIALTFFPFQTLPHLLASPAPPDSTTVLLARALGIITLALTPQLLLAYPNTKDAAGKRRIVYWTLGVGEAGLIPLLLWDAYQVRGSGLSRNAALMSVASLGPLLLWRVFVFVIRPDWLEGIQQIGDTRKKE